MTAKNNFARVRKLNFFSWLGKWEELKDSININFGLIKQFPKEFNCLLVIACILCIVQAGQIECCDVEETADMNITHIKLRACMKDEIIA